MSISSSRYRDLEDLQAETRAAGPAPGETADAQAGDVAPADPTRSLEGTGELLRLLADPTRVRLLQLLARDELSVAELVRITQLPQPRVSTHLGKLREAGLCRDRRSGSASFYAFEPERATGAIQRVWGALQSSVRDPLLAEDRERARQVLRQRGQGWAEGVAGQMERHYSPGRTWESALRGMLGLCRFGDVLDVASGDGALAALIAPRARSVTCLDVSSRVVAAGRRRLAELALVRFQQGDMHALPMADARFDEVLLMHALSYALEPAQVLREAARVLRPGGRAAIVTLARHPHRAIAESYDHLQTGFAPEELRKLVRDAGLVPEFCGVVAREKRSPHFEVIAVHALRPEARR